MTKEEFNQQEEKMKVYVLWHVYELRDDFGEHDEEKLIGIYLTEEKARDAKSTGKSGSQLTIVYKSEIKQIGLYKN